MNSKNLFANTPPVKLFFIAALPGALSMLASALYGLLDGIFVGRILGETAFAALNLAFPFVVINFSLADLIGLGSAVPIAINLGKKQEQEANNIFTCACVMIVLTGALIGGALYAAAPILIGMLGAEGDLARMAVEYMRVYAICSPVTTIVFAMDNYLRICSKIRRSLALNILMAVIGAALEFTFLFISPLLFAVHAVLAASMSTVMYLFGVVGNMGGGLIDQVLPQNWIPMFSNHADMMLTQIAIGLCFTLLYFVVFRTLILQFNMCTPGREDAEVKLYSKAEYKASRGQTTAAEPKKELDQAAGILQALGGVGNISSINNCATRLRIALHDMSQTLDDEVFKKLGAHGVFRSGDAIQVIIGLHVSQLREQLDSLINSHQSAENVAITEAV